MRRHLNSAPLAPRRRVCVSTEMGLAPNVLLLTAIDGAENLATTLSDRAGVVLELVRSRRAALASLRKYHFEAVMIDTNLPLGEVTPTQMLWQNTGEAVPMEVDLRALGASGTARLLRSILNQRRQMESQLRETVTRTLAEEMNGSITRMLLKSESMLRDRELKPETAESVREMRALADDLRARLQPVC